jgi:hypothetical protein
MTGLGDVTDSPRLRDFMELEELDTEGGSF